MKNFNQSIIVVLIYSLIFFPVSCGGSKSGGTAQQQILGSQNSLSNNISGDASAVLNAVETFNQTYGSVVTFDEQSGTAWLNYMNNTLSPSLQDLSSQMNQLIDEEDELQSLLSQIDSTQNLVRQIEVGGQQTRQAILTELFVVGTFFAAVAATFFAVDSKVKARVRSIETKLETSRKNGKSQAQALSEHSQEIKIAHGDTIRDIQTFIATNAVTSTVSEGLNHCGKIAVNLISAANDALETNSQNLQVIGKRNSSNSKNLFQTNNSNISTVYLGGTTTGTLDKLPLGNWDFVVFADGHVRGTINDLNITTCSATTQTSVNMTTTEELNEALAQTQVQQNQTNSDNQFTILNYVNSNGSTGSGQGGQITVSGSSSFPTIRWTLSNVIAVWVVDQSGNYLFGLNGIDLDPEDQDDRLTTINSPLTYGNYNVTNTERMTGFRSSSPAWQTTSFYIIEIATQDGKSAAIVVQRN